MRKKKVKQEDVSDILKQINAFNTFTKKGLEAALRLHPELGEFIEKNKHKSFEIVKKELIKKILKIKTDY